MSDNAAVHCDAFRMLIGERLGEGSSRDVYLSAFDSKHVIKVEGEAKRFQNVFEWETWERVRDTPYAKWFAPCVEISPNGMVLLMVRTDPIPTGKLPTRLPAFLSDFQPRNYGLLNGRVVCHDYGMHRAIERGLSKRTKKADWW